MWIKELWQNVSATVDKGGTPAWIGATVLGFMVFWPLGFLMLFGMFTREGKPMCNQNKRRFRNRSTGNTAFDNYREETLARLEEEQSAFNAYLQRLREARDQKEFDGWMKEMSAPAKS